MEEILRRDLVTESISRYLEQRSFFEIPYKDLLCRFPICLSCTDSLIEGSRTAISTENLFYRDLDKGSLQNLTWYLFSPNSVATLRGCYGNS